MGTQTAVPTFPTLSLDDKRFLLALARETLTAHLSGRGPPDVGPASAALQAPRASFVTLRRRDNGDLRGCRGERMARHPLVDSVMRMVVASAVDDPRFDPVRLHEVAGLQVEISALTAPLPIGAEDVVVGRHGLIVMAGVYGRSR